MFFTLLKYYQLVNGYDFLSDMIDEKIVPGQHVSKKNISHLVFNRVYFYVWLDPELIYRKFICSVISLLTTMPK